MAGSTRPDEHTLLSCVRVSAAPHMRREVPPVKHRLRLRAWLGLFVIAVTPTLWLPPARAVNDQPTDLTGKVAVIVTFQSRDNFANEYRYEVTIRNLGAEPLVGDSLMLIVDRVTNVGGEDREPLKSEPLLKRMEILGADGETEDGKPFFRISPDGNQDLLPQTESRPITVRLRNRDYVQVFTPAFRVMGMRRLPPAPKSQDLSAVPTAKTPVGKPQLDKLIQLLIKKGVLTEEEWRAANHPTP